MAFFGVRRALLFTTAYHPNNSFYGVTDPLIASINSTAWDATLSNAPLALNPLTNLVLSRQGFSATGATALYNETLTLTQRVRLPWPYQASIDPLRIALSDYVYSTDSCYDMPGVVNNSALTSPQPVCNWVLPDRQLVGNSLTAELVAFHRNARNGLQVACVVFTATDGVGGSVSATVATPTVSNTVGGVYNASTNPNGLDQNAVISYSTVLNLSGLANNTVITLNAQVYPWIGAGAGSIATTVGVTGPRAFCPQIYYKNTTMATTPTLAYVNSGGAGSDGNGSWLAGSDTTGVLSTTAATARATPFATIGGALTKMKTAAGAAGIDGGRVRLMAGTQTVGTVSYNTNYTINAEVIVEADPYASKATAILNFTASGPAYIPYLRIQNCTITRAAAAAFSSASTLTLYNVIFNDAGSANMKATNNSIQRSVGVTISGGCNFAESASIFQTLLRGINNQSNTTADYTLDPWCIVGSVFSRTQFSTGGLAESGVIFAFNRAMNKVKTTVNSIVLGSANSFTGAAIVQNVFERSCVDAGTGDFGISADGCTGNTTHFICHNNTVVFAGNSGHCNMLYNENTTVARSHTLQSFKGNIWGASATKNDTFLASQNGYVATNPVNIATCAGREGGWGYMYGCGVQGDLEIWMNSFGNAEGSSGNAVKDFAGLNCVFPTVFTASLAMHFTNYQAVTILNYGTNPSTSWVYTAGAGFGDYHINAGSAAIGVLPNPVLAFDLSGTARHSASTAAGAYEF